MFQSIYVMRGFLKVSNIGIRGVINDKDEFPFNFAFPSTLFVSTYCILSSQSWNPKDQTG